MACVCLAGDVATMEPLPPTVAGQWFPSFYQTLFSISVLPAWVPCLKKNYLLIVFNKYLNYFLILFNDLGTCN